MQQLDTGEAEALALAIEHENSMLLIDEAEGRKIAAIYRVNIIGTIGLLIRAYYENKINSFQTELDRLVSEAGFRISKSLYEKLINQVK
jgi:predicted nucleic acid-binding protein